MQAIDLQGNLGEYFFDEQRKITKAHLQAVCRIKQGEMACRYICLCVNGYVCMKKTKMHKVLDENVKKNKMSAKGDNCEGLGKYKQ